MLYKPNYCCNCGEKIERIEWNTLTSRRFCEVCQTEYPLDKILKIIFPTLLFLFSVFGISGYFQTNDNSVGVSKIEKTTVLTNVKDNKANDIRTLKTSNEATVDSTDEVNKSIENQANVNRANDPVEQNISQSDDPKQIVIAKTPQKTVLEAVYFCGAETKKGTPCSRKVKGGGRCWQHKGREAILSEKELKTGK